MTAPTENGWIEEIEKLDQYRLFDDDDNAYVRYSDLVGIMIRYYVRDIKIAK